MSARSLVRNAADPEQVQFARRKMARVEERRCNLVAQQLSTVYGREFVWAELERHGVHDLVDGPSEKVFLFLGKRAAGIELLQELMRDHPEAYLLMQQEALTRIARQGQELDAAHTPAVTQGEEHA